MSKSSQTNMFKFQRPEEKTRTIVVGTNSLTESQYPAYTNHCQFWFRLGRMFPSYKFIFCNPARMNIDTMRNMAAKVAIESNADYLLFLDDDVIVPLDGVQKLINLDTDIAAGHVIIRGWPFDCMFFKRTGDDIKPFTSWKEGRTILTREDSLEAVGFSFCLIKVSLLKKIQAPYFITAGNCTEDIYFCLKAIKQVPEVTMAVDTTIECGHILWPELITPSNKKAYKKYFLTLNPTLKGSKTPKAQDILADQEKTMAAMMKNMQVQK